MDLDSPQLFLPVTSHRISRYVTAVKLPSIYAAQLELLQAPESNLRGLRADNLYADIRRLSCQSTAHIYSDLRGVLTGQRQTCLPASGCKIDRIHRR